MTLVRHTSRCVCVCAGWGGQGGQCVHGQAGGRVRVERVAAQRVVSCRGAALRHLSLLCRPPTPSSLPSAPFLPPLSCKVVGCGGGGGNAIARMITAGLQVRVFVGATGTRPPVTDPRACCCASLRVTLALLRRLSCASACCRMWSFGRSTRTLRPSMPTSAPTSCRLACSSRAGSAQAARCASERAGGGHPGGGGVAGR
jgi:hypothetical protein